MDERVMRVYTGIALETCSLLAHGRCSTTNDGHAGGHAHAYCSWLQYNTVLALQTRMPSKILLGACCYLMAGNMLQLQQLLIGSPELHILIHQLIHTHCQGLALCLLPET